MLKNRIRVSKNYKKIIDNYEGKNNLPFFPSYFVIETSSLCNFFCSICPHKFMPVDRKGIMDLKLFKNILSQIKDYAKVIQLYWMGEPLLNENIFYKIKLCKNVTQAKVITSTNGSLLNDENIIRLLESGVDKIIVSMDAATNNDIYSNIRKGGNLKQLNKSVEKLIAENRKKNKKTEIFLQFIQLYENESQKEAFLNRWSKLDCMTSLSYLYSWCNQMPDLSEKSAFLSPMIGTERVACSDLWFKACIRFDGEVSLCCFDWNNSVSLGSLENDNLRTIWNNKLINQIRLEHRENKFNRLCCECDAWAIKTEYGTSF
jgi:MoaA/NifB/PqqE/SkfB family radical SAM enzyme